MNALIKTLVIGWLALSAVFVWFGCMIVGFGLSMSTNFYFMYHVTPFVGLACMISIIKTAVSVYKSNPVGYIRGKIASLQ